MTRNEFGLSLAALAAPVRHPGAFLRSATLPFLICMALAAALTVVALAYPSPAGQPSPDLPVFVQFLIFLLLGLALLSLISVSVAWRRRLASIGETQDAAALLTIDTSTFTYLLVRIGLTASPGNPVTTSRRSWFRILLALIGVLLTGCLFVLGGMVAMIAGAIGFAANDIPVQFFFSAIACCAFTYIWLVSADWQSCSAAAIGACPESAPSKSVSALRFFILGPLATLLFFGLSIAAPLPAIGEAQALPSIGIWLVGLFLVIAWFAALETLPFVAVDRPAGAMPGDGEYRSLRAPVPGQRA
jgi:hypothetical protein